MPNWNQLLDQIREDASQSAFDRIRRKYLRLLHKHTGRNVIVYYSGWLQKGELASKIPVQFGIVDSDKNGFMACVHGLNRSKGLDLLLHTPGGDVAAVESLIAYLHATFPQTLRVVIPQIAMSGGTMIALASEEIVMGKQSCIGPVDPQIGGVSASGIVEEFKTARADILANPATAEFWRPIISKYSPGLIGSCTRAIAWAEQLARGYLENGMFRGDTTAAAKAKTVVDTLASHDATLNHARHIATPKAQSLGLKISLLESDQKFQDLVLTVHHACCHTFSGANATKIIENHNGVAVIDSVATTIKIGP